MACPSPSLTVSTLDKSRPSCDAKAGPKSRSTCLVATAAEFTLGKPARYSSMTGTYLGCMGFMNFSRT